MEIRFVFCDCVVDNLKNTGEISDTKAAGKTKTPGEPNLAGPEFANESWKT